jgi:MFS family permease
VVFSMVRIFSSSLVPPLRNIHLVLTSVSSKSGNAGVARTAVGELAHNLQLDQGKAFSLFGFCSAIGYVIGPLLGGYLANPATKLSFQGPGNVFAEYPYLLPCLVCGCFDLTIAVIAFFLLEETNTRVSVSRKAITEDDEEEVCEPQIATENSRLLGEAIQRDGTQDLKQKSQYGVSTMSCILGIV